MSERYTKLCSLPQDLYAEGSPLIVSAGNLLKDTVTGKVMAQLKIRNISTKTVKAVTVLVHALDTAGRSLGNAVAYEYLDLSAVQGTEFGQKVPVFLPDPSVRGFTVEARETIFMDNSIWDGTDAPWEPLPSPEPLSRRLGDPELVKQYKIRFGSDCQFWPRVYKDLWLCTCGTWNRENGCYHCQKAVPALLALDLKELMAEKDARLAREKADREAKEAAEKAVAEKAAAEAAVREAAEKAAAEKRKRRNRRIALTFALIAALSVGGYFLWTDVIQPNQQYKEAVALYDAGRYQEAIAAFEALDGYKDSIAQIENCETAIKDAAYDTAVELHNAGKYEEAIAAFEALKGYRDSADQIINSETAIKDAAYDAAAALYNAGKYEEAIAAFNALNGYRDSTDQIANSETAIKDTAYDAAVALYYAGKYEEAIAAFKALNGYRDSTDQIINSETAIKDTAYDAAVALYNAGKYEEAIAAFTALDGYRDSAAKIKEIMPKYNKQLLSTASVGSTVLFGSYEQDNDTSNGKEDIEWIVLAKRNNQILIISKYVLDCQKYDADFTSVTWESCSLRKWLNGPFINKAFSTEEQKMILSTSVTADKNPSHNISPGGNTTDKVFLLSIVEAKQYFNSDETRSAPPTRYAYAQGAHVYVRSTIKYGVRCTYFWLRSPGYVSEYAAIIDIDGSIGYDGYGADIPHGIRPALWIDVS